MTNRHRQGYTNRWARAAKAFLRRNSKCTLCGEKAEHVDHKEPHNGNPVLFWLRSNWQALCRSCHSAKTMADRFGKPMRVPRSSYDASGQPRSPKHHWNATP